MERVNTSTTAHYFLDTVPAFLSYFGIAALLAVVFLVVYQAVTPQREFALIREGKTAPALSLVGAFLGFAAPLAMVISHSANILDVVLWGVTALVIQILVFFAVSRFFPKISDRISDNCISSGVFVGGLSLGFGILNAACMVP